MNRILIVFFLIMNLNSPVYAEEKKCRTFDIACKTKNFVSPTIEFQKKKFGEEAIELIVACVKKKKKEIIGEAADTLYHMCVLLRSKNISIDEVLSELVSREGVSGFEEKRKRNKK